VFARLPKEETYNLIGQMKRAGLSISNNLAEGAARKSKAEKPGFLRWPILRWWK
jgi:four helix bundle protein